MNLTIEIIQRADGNTLVEIMMPNGVGFGVDAPDLKTALIQCYAKVLNWMWMKKEG